MTLYQKTQQRRIQIGDIYIMQFAGFGSEQKGWRPGLVFQNNLGNKHSPNIIALPITSSLKKKEMVTHVMLPAEDAGLLKDSMVLCENPERMSKERLRDYITTLPENYMREIAVANLLATSAISFLDPSVLNTVWYQATMLNEAV